MSQQPRLIVDASVAIKWYVPEPDSARAVPILSSGVRLLAPDLIIAEIGNIVWRKVVRQELTRADAERIVTAFVLACPVEIVPAAALIVSAVEIAMQHGRSVYDSLYVALATREGCEMVTADERLVNALAGTPLGQHVVLLTAV